MPCTERARLLRLYSDATTRLSEAVTGLAETANSYEREAFDRTWERCEEARFLCTQIQHQIYDHLKEHRCGLDIQRSRKSG
jgi:hypothetical protein